MLEEIAEAQAWATWQANTAQLMRTHNIDHATAVRWLMEAEDVYGDRGYYLYCCGLDSKRWEAVFGSPRYTVVS